MFLIDDILLSPLKGVVWLAKELRAKAKEKMEDTPEKLKRKLLDAQMALEAGQITEEEYQEKEKDILERLEALKKKTKRSRNNSNK